MAGEITKSTKRSKSTNSIHRDSERGIDVLPACSLIRQNIVKHLSTLDHSLVNLSERLSGADCFIISRRDITSADIRPFNMIQQPRNCGLTVEGFLGSSPQAQSMLQRFENAAKIPKIRER